MERRELLKSAMAGGLAVSAATLLAPYACAEVEQGEVKPGSAGVSADSATARAFAGLLEVLAEQDQAFAKPEWRVRTPQDAADARRMLLHTLMHALQTWLEADPQRPFFVSFINRHKKMLGDNPDARYHQTVIGGGHRYRIYGNLAGATYTSFTVEMGVGSESTGLGPTLNDTEFKTDADGNYEIFLTPEKEGENWLPLPEGAVSLVTRHYYERELSINNDILHHIPIAIECLDEVPPRPANNDAAMAAGIRRVTEFMRRGVVRMDASNSPGWVSRVPNQFAKVEKDDSNEEIAYAAKDNVYAMAPYVLQPNQALVIRGRFPKGRFGSVLLHTQFLQTYDYETRQISLNRKQVKYEADGSFKIVVAHRDPGIPNWLDTEGRLFGIMFWRFQLPEEPIQQLETEVITLPV